MEVKGLDGAKEDGGLMTEALYCREGVEMDLVVG